MPKRPWITTPDGIAHLGQPMEGAAGMQDMVAYSRCIVRDMTTGEVLYDGPDSAEWFEEHPNEMFNVEMIP